MIQSKTYEFWFVAGSQHLYGEEAVREVEEHSKIMCRGLNDSQLRFSVKYKTVVTSPDGVTKLMREANSDDACAGVITWMHTFSPAKIWIQGLTELKKPLLHFHTQFNRDPVGQNRHGLYEYQPISTRRPRIWVYRNKIRSSA